jgi:LAGLIDADG endonuclease
LHKKDLDLLKSIKSYFDGVGIISESKSKDMCAFRVSSPKQILEKVLPHFDKYPLVTKKYIDYQLFKNIVEIILNKEHLTDSGLQNIMNLRASLNLGLSDKLKAAFPNTIPVERLILTKQQIPHPQ